MNIYLATIQVAIAIPDEILPPSRDAYACDVVSETLPRFHPKWGLLFDWQYLGDKNCPVFARKVERKDWEEFEEGEAFNTDVSTYEDFEVTLRDTDKEQETNVMLSEVVQAVNMCYPPAKDFIVAQEAEGIAIRSGTIVARVWPTEPTPTKIERLQGLLT